MKSLSIAAILVCGSLLSGCATLAIGAIGGYLTAQAVGTAVVTGAVSGTSSYFVRRSWEKRELRRLRAQRYARGYN